MHTAAREAGHGTLDGLRAVILQQDGSLGVISDESMGDGATVLPYVEGKPKAKVLLPFSLVTRHLTLS